MKKDWEQYVELADQIDLTRIINVIEFLGKKTDTPGNGVTRLAFSDTYFSGKDYIADLMDDIGLRVEVTPIGNTIGHLSVRNDNNPVVMTGSHTDTVVNAGQYDGIVGVACAIEVARILKQISQHLTYPIEVIDFSLEEASRFGALRALGSSALSGGVITESQLLTRDTHGITVAEALGGVKHLKHFGLGSTETTGNTLEEAVRAVQLSRRTASSIRGFIELHVEQAQVLEEANIPIGIVTGAAAPTRVMIELIGQQSHSGTTPMSKRRNPLVAASEIVLYVDALCSANKENGLVGAITKLIVEPNSVNTVPGRCLLWLDLRSTTKSSKENAYRAIKSKMEQICRDRGIELKIEILLDEDPVTFSEEIIEAAEASCKLIDMNYMRIPSRAGHDACGLARLVENVGMIFIPSRGGISHHPLEWTDPKHIFIGAKVLLLSILQFALD